MIRESTELAKNADIIQLKVGTNGGSPNERDRNDD